MTEKHTAKSTNQGNQLQPSTQQISRRESSGVAPINQIDFDPEAFPSKVICHSRPSYESERRSKSGRKMQWDIANSKDSDTDYVPDIDSTITIAGSNLDNAADGNMLRRSPLGGGVEERVSLHVE